MRKAKSYEMDMTEGALLPKILTFALPLMLSSVLQLLFNAADIVVVGRFNGERALAAVGSTAALINLIVNIFIGLSIGANVIVARHYAAREAEALSKAVHTSITVALAGGAFLAVFGFALCGQFLRWMSSPEDVLPLSTLYMRIYFIGMPFNMLYNFGSAVLRSVGDTRRPLIFLMIAGVVNVLLNLFFVIVFHMGVAGVALATIISQGVSSILVLLCLIRNQGQVRVELKKLGIDMGILGEIARIGLPAGLQGMCFSISNVLIQSTVNSFGTVAVAGNAAAANIEGFVYVAMNTLYQAAITFTSQNYGAKKFSRIRRIMVLCISVVTALGLFMGLVGLAFGRQLLGIYSDMDEVIRAGMVRMKLIMPTYFLCGIMDSLCGCLRGLGKTIVPMIVSVFGACALRILWIWLVLPSHHSMQCLYLSYPISWTVTTLVHFACLMKAQQSLPRQDLAQN